MHNQLPSGFRCDPTATGFGPDRAALRLPRLTLDNHDDAWLPAHINAVVGGDFWGDGGTDLIVFMSISPAALASVLHWKNSGYVLVSALQYSASGALDDACAARIRPDLIGAIGVSTSRNELQLIWKDGNDSFQKSFSPAGASFCRVQCADLRGSGSSDVIALTKNRMEIGIFYNKGDGSFYPPVVIRSPVETQTFTVADLRRNGVFDIVIAGKTPQHEHHVFVCEGLGNGLFSDARHVFGGPGAATNIHRLVAGDVSGRGGTELLVVDSQYNSIAKLAQYSGGSFQHVERLPEFPGEQTFGPMDAVLLSGEGSQPDIALMGAEGQGRVMRADGRGGYRAIDSFELDNDFGVLDMLTIPVNGKAALLICDDNDVIHTIY